MPDGLIIRQSAPKPANLHGWADHRIVMPLAIGGLALEGQCAIDTAKAMSVTFPDYARLMKSIGANLKTTK